MNADARGESTCSECQAPVQIAWKACPTCGTSRNRDTAAGGDSPNLPDGWYLGPNGEICTGTSCVRAEKTPDGKFIVRLDPAGCDPQLRPRQGLQPPARPGRKELPVTGVPEDGAERRPVGHGLNHVWVNQAGVLAVEFRVEAASASVHHHGLHHQAGLPIGDWWDRGRRGGDIDLPELTGAHRRHQIVKRSAPINRGASLSPGRESSRFSA